MFPKLKEVVVLDGFKLRLKYQNGAEGVFDFEMKVGFSGSFEKLRNPEEFRKVRISRDGWRTLSWPGKLDLDPVTVYSDTTGLSVEEVTTQKDKARPQIRRDSRFRELEAKPTKGTRQGKTN